MDCKIKNYIKNKSGIDDKFIDKFYDIIANKIDFVNYDIIKNCIGYKKKETIKEILLNKKYNFIEGKDYIFYKQKSTGGRPCIAMKLHVDTIKMLCMMASTKKGQQFRRYYIEMDRIFKKYVSTELLNKLDNPIPELNKYDFDINKYKDKEVLYLIYLEDNLYKYGITANIWKRLKSHKRTIGYDYVIKCWDCINRTVSAKIENAVKKYIKINKMSDIYKKQTEILKIDNINDIIDIFNRYVDIHVTVYNDQFKNAYMTQKLNIVNAQIELLDKIKTLDNKCSTPNINVNISIDPRSNYMNIHTVNDLNKMLQDDKNIINNKINQPNQPIEDDPLDNKLKDLVYCKRCRAHKYSVCFGFNEKTMSLYKQCYECRESGKISDAKRANSENRIEWRKKHNIEYQQKNKVQIAERKRIKREKDRLRKKEAYKKNKEKILEKNRRYYQKNKDNIIEHKRDYTIRKQLEKHDGTVYCKRCRTHKILSEYRINKKTNKQYKQCNKCLTRL